MYHSTSSSRILVFQKAFELFQTNLESKVHLSMHLHLKPINHWFYIILSGWQYGLSMNAEFFSVAVDMVNGYVGYLIQNIEHPFCSSLNSQYCTLVDPLRNQALSWINGLYYFH